LDFSPQATAGLFKPRASATPRVDFDHRSREWYRPSLAEKHGRHGGVVENIVIHKAHFTKDFIAGLRARASEGRGRPFSRFETILAHLWLWRAMTRARGLNPDETSRSRRSGCPWTYGRHRLGLPAEYFGNLVLWAFPTARRWWTSWGGR
jgi:hypothetical protein